MSVQKMLTDRKTARQKIRNILLNAYPVSTIRLPTCPYVCVCVFVRSSVSVCACIFVYIVKSWVECPTVFPVLCSPCSVHGQLHCCVAQQCSYNNNNNITYDEHKDETQAQQCCCWCCCAPLLLPNMAAHELKLNLKRQRCCQ